MQNKSTPPPIRIINLEKYQDRRLNMRNQLDAMGLDYQLVSAVDGDRLTQEQVDEVYSEADALRYLFRPLTRGEIGCAMSHISVYREMVREGIETMLILEDDVVLEQATVQVLAASNRFPTGWDIVFLNYGCNSLNTLLYRIPHRLRVYRHQLRKPMGKWKLDLTGAYIISKSGAEKLLSQTDCLVKPIDNYTGDYRALDIYTVVPKCVVQDERFPSSLKPKRSILQKDAEVNKGNIRKTEWVVKSLVRNILMITRLYYPLRKAKFYILSAVYYLFWSLVYFKRELKNLD